MTTLAVPSASDISTFSRAVRQHLKAVRNEYNADLIDAYLKDAPFIETQLNIRTDIGEPRVAEATKRQDDQLQSGRQHGFQEHPLSAIRRHRPAVG